MSVMRRAVRRDLIRVESEAAELRGRLEAEVTQPLTPDLVLRYKQQSRWIREALDDLDQHISQLGDISGNPNQ